MKRIILSAICLAAWSSVFAQGKVTLAVDSASLVTLDSNPANVLPADTGLAGQPVGNQTPLPSGVVVTIGLYAGTNPTSLALQGAGRMDDPAFASGVVAWTRVHHIILSGINGTTSGTPIGSGTPWMQVKVWDSAYASYELTPADHYRGQGALFQMNPGNSLAYPTTAPPSVNSTWVEAPIVVRAATGSPAVLLTFLAMDNQLILSWTNANFNLQSSLLVEGAYTNVLGSSSPHTNLMSEAQQFFRLKQN